MTKKRIPKVRICTVDYQPIGSTEKHVSYATRGGTFYFHHQCYKSLCNERGQRIPSKFIHAIMEFSRKGHKPTILKSDMPKHPKVHVTSFEPANHQKLDDLRLIIEVLRHYKKPMTRNDISREAQIPKGTVTWRIWDNMEGKSKEPLFYIDETKRGERGMELVGLVDFS